MRKVSGLFLSIVFLISLFSTVAFADTAHMETVDGDSHFNKSFCKCIELKDPHTGFCMGTLICKFNKTTGKDKATCTCEHDYSHTATLVIGRNSGNVKYYNKTIKTHGNAEVTKAHRPHGTSYGGLINY